MVVEQMVNCYKNDLMNDFNDLMHDFKKIYKQTQDQADTEHLRALPGTSPEALGYREVSLTGIDAFRGIRGGSNHFI